MKPLIDKIRTISHACAGHVAGDGAFYIAKFLNRLTLSSTTAGKYVQSTCNALHYKTEDGKGSDQDRSDCKSVALATYLTLVVLANAGWYLVQHGPGVCL